MTLLPKALPRRKSGHYVLVPEVTVQPVRPQHIRRQPLQHPEGCPYLRRSLAQHFDGDCRVAAARAVTRTYVELTDL
jgi:hypothetical protein